LLAFPLLLLLPTAMSHLRYTIKEGPKVLQYATAHTIPATTGALSYKPVPPVSERRKPLMRPPPVLLDRTENRLAVLKQYRKIVRNMPRVLLAFEITGVSGGPENKVIERTALANVRRHFERHAGVTDLGVAAMLRHKAEMEVEETLLLWKTKSHVCNLVLDESSPPIAKIMQQQQSEKTLPKQAVQSPFLSSFLQG
jgi:hypothetical protein